MFQLTAVDLKDGRVVADLSLDVASIECFTVICKNCFINKFCFFANMEIENFLLLLGNWLTINLFVDC